MPDTIRTNGTGESRSHSPKHSFVTYRSKEGVVAIRLTIGDAEILSEILTTIAGSRTLNSENWRLIADIAHDLDRKLEMLRKDPS